MAHGSWRAYPGHYYGHPNQTGVEGGGVLGAESLGWRSCRTSQKKEGVMLDDPALDQDAMTREDEAGTFTGLDQQQSAHGVQVLGILLMGDKQSMLNNPWLGRLTDTNVLLRLLVIAPHPGN